MFSVYEYQVKVELAPPENHLDQHGTVFVTLEGSQGSEFIELSDQ
jgi:hypothetical protein